MMTDQTASLFADFDPAEVAAASRQFQADKRETGRARAQKSANKHHMRRANAKAHLAYFDVLIK